MRILRTTLFVSLLAWLLCRLASAPSYPRETPHHRIEILRDEQGAPHVFAQDTWDLYFGQGFATAADRIFQMDWTRRALLGRQAEVAGPAYIRSDFVSRALELREVCQEFYFSLPAKDRLPLDAFASGVNAWLRSHDLPREFHLLHYRPKAWRGWDVLVIGRGMAIQLTNLTDDLAQKQRAGQTALQGGLELPEGFRAGVGEGRRASNAWAVAPSRSRFGHALLACDSHLGLTQPGPFSRIALSAPGIAATGYAVPGIPGLAFGRTRGVAWGITAFSGDTADLFRSELEPGNPRRYRVGDEWKPVIKRRPVVLLRLHRFLTVPVFWQALEYTHIGPVIRRGEHDLLSLAWEGRSYGASERLFTTGIIEANSRAQVEEVLRHHALPDLNVVVADTAGSIARYIAARIPKRRPHPGPRPADDSSLAWQGTVPFDELPHVIDPPEGFIASANNAPAESPNYLGWGFGKTRYRRIRHLLSAEASFGLASMETLQADVRVPEAAEDRDALLATLDARDLAPLERTAYAILASWDLRAEEDAAGMTVFRMARAFGFGTENFRRAVAWLRTSLGDDPFAWTWGRIHVVRFDHPLGDRDASLSLGPFPRRGDHATLDVAPYTWPDWSEGARPGTQILVSKFGPAFRYVTELGGGDRMDGILPAGQSGDPGSPHYRDQIDDWLGNRYHPYTPPGERPRTITERIIVEP